MQGRRSLSGSEKEHVCTFLQIKFLFLVSVSLCGIDELPLTIRQPFSKTDPPLPGHLSLDSLVSCYCRGEKKTGRSLYFLVIPTRNCLWPEECQRSRDTTTGVQSRAGPSVRRLKYLICPGGKLAKKNQRETIAFRQKESGRMC